MYSPLYTAYCIRGLRSTEQVGIHFGIRARYWACQNPTLFKHLWTTWVGHIFSFDNGTNIDLLMILFHCAINISKLFQIKPLFRCYTLFNFIDADGDLKLLPMKIGYEWDIWNGNVEIPLNLEILVNVNTRAKTGILESMFQIWAWITPLKQNEKYAWIIYQSWWFV